MLQLQIRNTIAFLFSQHRTWSVAIQLHLAKNYVVKLINCKQLREKARFKPYLLD